MGQMRTVVRKLSVNAAQIARGRAYGAAGEALRRKLDPAYRRAAVYTTDDIIRAGKRLEEEE